MQYSNNEEIIKSTSNLDAARLDVADNELLVSQIFEIAALDESARDNFELHVYTPDGIYLTGDHKLIFDSSTNISDNKRPSYTVQINLKDELNKLNIQRGQYKIIVNFFDTLIGDIDNKRVWVKEISNTKQEIKLSIPKLFIPYLDKLFDLRYNAYLQGYASNFVLNFGNNLTYPILNAKLESKYDLTPIRKYTIPGVNVTDYDAIKEYTIENLPNGAIIRSIDREGQFGDFYLMENGKKRPFNGNQWLLFEFCKLLDAARFNSNGDLVRAAYPTLIDNGYGTIIPNLINISARDISFITTGEPVTINDLVGTEDYINLIVRLYKPLDAAITEKSKAFISNEYREPYTDTVYLIDKVEPIQYNQLRPANFNIDAYSKQSIPTEYKSWNDLLDANLTTSQKLIDTYFSGSLQGVRLNINYGEFDSFVHFSSAEERVKNFRYKLELIQYYTDKITSLSGSVYTNLTTLYEKRNAIVSTFDNFENYLFYDSGSLQLYTHVSYSIDPWPKLSVNNNPNDPYTQFGNLYRISQSVAEDYYNDLLEQAITYDHYNVHRLLKAVPLHIRSTEGNEDFNLFVDMLGHHYDIIWTYINHFSKIYSREEHPQDGMSNDLIYHAAKSLGLQLYNGRSTTELWKYVYGTDNSGSLSQEGVNGVYSLPERQVTHEYWRRLINNLPYLLKTKGTERSIKALLSCFGIPSTLLTIKEFGGPSTFVEEATHYPEYVHEKFAFAYKVNTGTYANYLQVLPSKTNNKFSKNVNALEFRFRSDTEEIYTAGTEYNLFSYNTGITFENSSSITTAPSLAITVKKDSDTDTEGTLTLRISGNDATISNINIFDNGFNLLYLEQAGSNTTLQYRKAKYGKIVETGSATLATTVMFDDINDTNALGAMRWGNPGTVTLDAALSPFIGHIQEIRLWSGSLNTASLNEHALSPNTYTYNVNRGGLTGNEALEPYNRLIQRYTLSNKYFNTLTASFSTPTSTDGFARTYQLSSHPNQKLDAYKFENFSNNQLGGGIWLVNVSGSEQINEVFDSFEDTYYTPSPSLGGNSLYTNKVRIEQNSLTGFLSPKKRVEASSFDKFSVDSNKIGIYFSPQDSINEDIFNQLGYYEIDDYIGDPSDIYGDHYPAFEDFAADYWLKYDNKNDFEAFFRALSIYDTSIFRYIKDTLPARANVVDGYLIEPNALERKRFRTTKPTIENLSYEAEIEAPIHVQEAFYLTYEGSIENPAPEIDSDYLIQPDAILDIASAIDIIGDCLNLDIAEIPAIDSNLNKLGSTWYQNRYVGNFVVEETGSYTPIQTIITAQRYEITGSSYSLNSYSGSIANAYQYIDDAIAVAETGGGGGGYAPSE
jgi:hypothetical protein